MIKIIFPEMENPIIKEAALAVEGIQAIGAENLETACSAVREGVADAMIAGLDYTSRDVILSCRDIIGMTGQTFSSSLAMSRGNETYILADAATCKHPTASQLYDIICQTWTTAKCILKDEPRVAVLSFSTLGSGGHDPSMELAIEVIKKVQSTRPEILIDGEMQLDAAIVPEIAHKKAPASPVAGRANVLIAPDLNSGNILYKSMEHLGGFTAAGPILQGFKAVVSDLSRGSSVADIKSVIEIIKQIMEEKHV